MLKTIAKNVVDEIVILDNSVHSPPEIAVNANASLVHIKNFLESVNLVHLNTCAKCVYEKISFGNDFSFFDFGEEPASETEPFEGVRFSDMSGQNIFLEL